MHQVLKATISAVQGLPFIPVRVRVHLLRAYGIRAGKNVGVFERVFFGSNRVRIGRGCFISINCIFDAAASITLGSYVFLAPGVKLITSDHEPGPANKRAGLLTSADIVIGDGCWLGAGATVLPGIKIAPGCIIGAGAVVTKDCAANGVYVGVPARRIRDLEP